jgi:hypothetical protein
MPKLLGIFAMNTTTILVALTLLITATMFAAPVNPHLGTWKLNEKKSRVTPDGTRNTVVTYKETDSGMIEVIVNGTTKNGKHIHWKWVGRFDGQPYNIHGDRVVDTMALTKLDERTNQLTGIKSGKVIMTGTISVAADGKSRVVKTTTTNANGKKQFDTAYYDKQ